jgi:hypothetical protein
VLANVVRRSYLRLNLGRQNHSILISRARRLNKLLCTDRTMLSANTVVDRLAPFFLNSHKIGGPRSVCGCYFPMLLRVAMLDSSDTSTLRKDGGCAIGPEFLISFRVLFRGHRCVWEVLSCCIGRVS